MIVLRNRRLACGNSKLKVYADDIETDSAAVAGYLVVAGAGDPMEDGPPAPIGVTVLPLRGAEVGLQRIFRHPIRSWALEAPRGFVDPGESVRAAARRELTEEAGLDCAEEDLVDLGTVCPEGGVMRARIALFAAPDCRPVAAAREDDIGIGAFHWMPLDEAVARAADGGIEDASTALGLLRLRHRNCLESETLLHGKTGEASKGTVVDE
ncbi:MAG: NUDIX hydrolase [Caulobacter sp.]|nr:NUDIX hydrolase [Caulobacter sp.]